MVAKHPPGLMSAGEGREGGMGVGENYWVVPASGEVVAGVGAPGRWSEGQAESPVGQL